MSSQREDYQPPYEAAEKIFTNDNKPGPEFNDRFFIIHDSNEDGYWRRIPTGEPSGYESERDKAGVWSGKEMLAWSFGGCLIQMLPIPGPSLPKTPTEADREVKWEELGKQGPNRFCIIKDTSGKYIGRDLQPVDDRKEAWVYALKKVHAIEQFKPFIFELLVPPDAFTEGYPMEEVICFTEAQRQEDRRRFLVRSVKANQVNGYYYYDEGRTTACVSRKRAHMMDRKELRRRFYDVPKGDIIIELLKPLPLSKLSDFFVESAIALIKQAPNNATLRGFMMTKLKVMPPKELDTFDKLKEWIEWNVEKKSPKPVEEEGVVRPAETLDEITMAITVRRKRDELGTATYRVRQTGTDRLEISVAELRSLAEASGDFGRFRTRLLNELHTYDVIDVDFDDVAEHSYEDHDMSDYDNRETVWPSMSEADATIKAFMRTHMPDILTRLEGRI